MCASGKNFSVYLASVIFLSSLLLSCSPLQIKKDRHNVIKDANVHHDIDLDIDFTESGIQVRDEVQLVAKAPTLSMQLNPSLTINRISLDNRDLVWKIVASDGKPDIVEISFPSDPSNKVVKIVIEYSGKFQSIDFNDGRHRGTEVEAYINKDSAVLLSNANWHSIFLPERFLTYTLRISAPEGQEVLAAGEKTKSSGSSRIITFDMFEPTDGINLFSGPYTVKEDRLGKTKLYSYFLEQDSDIAEKYLSAMKDHIKRYSNRFTPYPYPAMSIISTPIMEGLGFPGFTMIGEKLLRIPNMEKMSLGHEILHNWFGNGVYADPNEGNWTEGLVNYLHDFDMSAKRSGEGPARRNLLKYYTLYTKAEESSLLEFKERDSAAAMGVGYFKSAFVFAMLENELGEKVFDKSLKVLLKKKMFQQASWEDLQEVFEKTSGKNLDAFFKHWINTPNAPSISIAGVAPRSENSVSITLKSEPFFPYNLPVVIDTVMGQENKVFSITGSPQSIEISALNKIDTIGIDPTYTILRKLLPEELPMSIASVLETNNELPVVFSDSLTPELRKMYESFLEKSGIKYSELSSIDESDGPTIIIGPPTSTGMSSASSKMFSDEVPWKWEDSALTIENTTIQEGEDSAIFSWHGPKGVKQPIVWILGFSEEGLESLSKRYGYFMTDSFVMFKKGQRPKRGEWEPKNNPFIITVPKPI